MLAFVVIGGLMGKASARRTTRRSSTCGCSKTSSRSSGNYVEEVKVDKVMEGAMRGLADGLDPDSAYLTAAQVRAVEAGEPLPDGDVGIELTRQYYLRVIAARDGSPGAKAGLQTGDYVRAIDGKPTRDMSVFEGIRLLRGQPGSKVVLTVIRGNAAEPHEVDLVREKPRRCRRDRARCSAPASATSASPRSRRRRPPKLTAAGRRAGERSARRALIIDLRRTAEGPFDARHRRGAAVREVRHAGDQGGARQDGPRETIAAKAGDGAITLPVTLLVTTGTSGAAELFAAALDGNKRAELVGERTLGRAGLQKLVQLPEGRGLWLTYARYLTPDGEPSTGKGLKPDRAVDEPDVDFGAPAPANDPILDAALEGQGKRPPRAGPVDGCLPSTRHC